MLLSCVAFALVLVSTRVEGVPLASLPSSYSKRVLLERAPDKKLCSLKRLCIQNVDKLLNDVRVEGEFDYKNHLSDDRWPETSKCYAAHQAWFTEVIWSTHPSMKRHIEFVHQLVLEPGFYTSTGQPVEPEAEGALINMLEAEISRALLERETIARQNRNADRITVLNKTIQRLARTWTEMANANDINPSAERRNAYRGLYIDQDHPQFVYYYNDEEPLTDRRTEVEGYVQAKAAKFLNHEMSGPEVYAFLGFLHKELRDIVRTGDRSPSEEDLNLEELRAPATDRIYGSDRYARYHEMFKAIYRRDPVIMRGFEIRVGTYTYDPATGEAGPGRINTLEAEYRRGIAMQKLRWRFDGSSDMVTFVRDTLANMNSLEAWAMAVKKKTFVPYERSSRVLYHHLTWERIIQQLEKEPWDLQVRDLHLRAEVHRVLTGRQGIEWPW